MSLQIMKNMKLIIFFTKGDKMTSVDYGFFRKQFNNLNEKLDILHSAKPSKIDQDRIEECIKAIIAVKPAGKILAIKIYKILMGCNLITAKKDVEKILDVSIGDE